tara:strand:+ start:298 stop:828 length:531 start_codon:yes stop_codon:yes gene_type:complete
MSDATQTSLIRTDPVVMAVWKRLTSTFATWRLILLAGFTHRGLYQLSNDQVSPLITTAHWKLGLGLLGGLDDAQIGFLTTFAEMNASRAERVFRTNTLILVTIPVGLIIGINEVFPEIWDQAGFNQIDTIASVLAAWVVVAGLMMAASWRARDLADLLVFEAARRELARQQRVAPT